MEWVVWCGDALGGLRLLWRCGWISNCGDGHDDVNFFVDNMGSKCVELVSCCFGYRKE
jgi:hypothetical protein